MPAAPITKATSAVMIDLIISELRLVSIQRPDVFTGNPMQPSRSTAPCHHVPEVNTSPVWLAVDTICQGLILPKLPIRARFDFNGSVIRWMSVHQQDVIQLG
jgi:hypothetical protein